MPRRILCVEDHAEIAHYLRVLLELKGYEVVNAGSFAQGLTAIQTQTFDLILLDNGLPDGTGLDLCRRLRMTGEQTPIVFFTSNHDPLFKSRAHAAGAQDCIKKSAGTEDLLNAIAAHANNAVFSEPLLRSST